MMKLVVLFLGLTPFMLHSQVQQALSSYDVMPVAIIDACLNELNAQGLHEGATYYSDGRYFSDSCKELIFDDPKGVIELKRIDLEEFKLLDPHQQHYFFYSILWNQNTSIVQMVDVSFQKRIEIHLLRTNHGWEVETLKANNSKPSPSRC